MSRATYSILKATVPLLFEKLAWVLKARARKDVRPALNGLLVDTNRLICTDGHRLHLWRTKVDDLYPGLYEVEKATQSEIILNVIKKEDMPLPFPNVDQVIPKKPKLPVLLDTCKEAAFYQFMLNLEKRPEGKDHYLVVQWKYFEEAWKVCNDLQTPWEGCFDGANSGARLDKGDLMALIMPMRGGKKPS